MGVRLKQRAVIEFLTAEGVSPAQIYRRMQGVYGEACMDESTVRRWANVVKGTDPSHSKLTNKPRSGRPVTATDVTQEAVDKLIRDNRRIKQTEIALQLNISKERVGFSSANF